MVQAEGITVSILKTEPGERMSGEMRIEGLSEGSAAHELAISIEDGLKSSMSQLIRRGDRTIPRVPRLLREAESNLYEPNLVSIGPYYHGKIQAMEIDKWKHLHAILSRNREIGLVDYIKEMKAMEARARGCYTESFSLSSDEFVQMMLLDGCLIISIMLSFQDALAGHGLPFWEQHCELVEWRCLNRDMLLLENQLPYFILECILRLVSSNRQNRPMRKLALDYLKFFYVRFLNFDVPVKQTYDHLLEQFHYHCSPISWEPPSLSIELKNLITSRTSESEENWEAKLDAFVRHVQLLDYSNPPAEDLEDAGIEFKRKKQGGILDIEFNKRSGLMEIPQLVFINGDDHVFSNLIAFELCKQEGREFFSGYAVFMDSIIKSSKDVKILHRSAIVAHNLGSHEEFVRVFNQLRKRVYLNPGASHLFQQYKQAKEFCSAKRHIWRASLVRDYFKSPWAILSFLAAILFLLLTMIQTFFAAYPFAHR